MNSNEKNTALYEKMAAEQDTFRDWLKSQSPEEVLNHAYEYTVREDIVLAMEELELSDNQAQALLDSPSPLADVYRHFEKLETGYMDVIRESIEERANEMHRAKRNREPPQSIPTPPPMRPSMGRWRSTAPPCKPVLPAKKPLSRPLTPTMGITV